MGSCRGDDSAPKAFPLRRRLLRVHAAELAPRSVRINLGVVLYYAPTGRTYPLGSIRYSVVFLRRDLPVVGTGLGGLGSRC